MGIGGIGGSVGRAVAQRVPVPDNLDDAINDALDKAVEVQRGTILAYIRRAQDKDPALTPYDLSIRLEKRYRASVISIGAIAGGAGAMPGVGTVASIASGVVEIGAFIEATAVFTLARAEVQGITVTDVPTRRALVLAVLLGEGGVRALEAAGGAAAAGGSWSGLLRHGLPGGGSALNRRLMKRFLTRFATQQGALVAGRALPFGVGAAIGGAGNYAVAKAAIAASRQLFGPPPPEFPPKIVDLGRR